MPRSEQQARTELKDFLPIFDAIVQAALEAYAKLPAGVLKDHSARTRASNISDLLHKEVVARLQSMPGVNVIKRATTISVDIYGGQYLVKFKKLDRLGRASFIPTQAALRFANQQLAQLHLKPLPIPATSLYVGYVLHAVALTKSSTWVACPSGRTAHWSFEVPKQQPVVVPFTAPAPAPSASGGRRRKSNVKPKAKSKPNLKIVPKKGGADGNDGA